MLRTDPPVETSPHGSAGNGRLSNFRFRFETDNLLASGRSYWGILRATRCAIGQLLGPMDGPTAHRFATSTW